MKFTVIIPTYNRKKIISKCIDSVLSQTYKNFEIIVVDNGSTDNTEQVIKNYIKQDNRIKYIWQENSGSPAGSRNTGIKNSVGEWIAFLDSDDYWLSEKLNEIYLEIKKSKDVIAISHWEQKEVNDIFDSILEHGVTPCNNFYENLLFKGNCLSTSAMNVKKEALISVDLFDERKEYFAVEDYDLWMKLSKIGNFSFIKKVLGAFCIGNENMSSNIDLINNNLSNVIENHIKSLQLPINEEKKLLKKHLSKIEGYRGRAYQLNGDFNKANAILVKSIISYPFSVHKWAYLFLSLIKVKK